MILPYEMDVPFTRRPWANYVLMGATIALSTACLVDPQMAEVLALGRRDVPAEIRDLPSLSESSYFRQSYPVRFEAYSFVTHGFVHAGIIHLAGNMVFLFVFGNAVNYKLGQVGYTAAYLAMMTLAGGVHVAARGTPAVGASGAIYGIIGLFVAFFPLNQVRCVYFAFFRLHEHLGWFEVSSVWIVAFWLVTDALMMRFDLAGNVAVEAHLGGATAGLVAGLLLLLARIVRPAESERTLLDIVCRRS